MTENKEENVDFPICIEYNPKDKDNSCAKNDGKCLHYNNCRLKNTNVPFGSYTLNKFKEEITKNLVDIVFSMNKNEIFKENKRTFRFNFKNFNITLKIEKNW